MSGKLVEIQEMGGGGVVEGNMGCNGVPSRWSSSIRVTWCFRTSSFQDLTLLVLKTLNTFNTQTKMGFFLSLVEIVEEKVFYLL